MLLPVPALVPAVPVPAAGPRGDGREGEVSLAHAHSSTLLSSSAQVRQSPEIGKEFGMKFGSGLARVARKRATHQVEPCAASGSPSARAAASGPPGTEASAST